MRGGGCLKSWMDAPRFGLWQTANNAPPRHSAWARSSSERRLKPARLERGLDDLSHFGGGQFNRVGLGAAGRKRFPDQRGDIFGGDAVMGEGGNLQATAQ